ncbi:abc transporter g family member 39 [Nicotiana attenuata]|uniref:Abc transporter g family member 39 n=1 Tax=Nicotiana attenuata TaxID=49451 RepID=A0A1J6JXP2_NICAT|nr:abc transporter g family member 39 [Nicotiana attenuata]
MSMEANIKPDADVDIFMKVLFNSQHGMKDRKLMLRAEKETNYRGDDGWTSKSIFMDEISTGLDSSTTYQIVNSIRQSIHILQGTAVISLLQPAPETYDLFDDIILLSDGQIVYKGPRENVLEFFEYMGFMCPERKGVADFLQEVTSRKDQEQYWARRDEPYKFITMRKFSESFQSFHIGRMLGDELAVPYD